PSGAWAAEFSGGFFGVGLRFLRGVGDHAAFSLGVDLRPLDSGDIVPCGDGNAWYAGPVWLSYAVGLAVPVEVSDPGGELLPIVSQCDWPSQTSFGRTLAFLDTP